MPKFPRCIIFHGRKLFCRCCCTSNEIHEIPNLLHNARSKHLFIRFLCVLLPVLINMFVSFSPPRNCTLQHIIVSMKKPHWEKRSFSARRGTSTPHKKIVVFPVSTHKRYISSKFPSFPHSPLHFSSTERSNYVCSFICSTDVVIHTWVHYVSPSYQ